MKDAEYNLRQKAAMYRLRRMGGAKLLRRAQKWIPKNMPPENWRGTPLEWAEEEMPTNLFLWLLDLL